MCVSSFQQVLSPASPGGKKKTQGRALIGPARVTLPNYQSWWPGERGTAPPIHTHRGGQENSVVRGRRRGDKGRVTGGRGPQAVLYPPPVTEHLPCVGPGLCVTCSHALSSVFIAVHHLLSVDRVEGGMLPAFHLPRGSRGGLFRKVSAPKEVIVQWSLLQTLFHRLPDLKVAAPGLHIYV